MAIFQNKKIRDLDISVCYLLVKSGPDGSCTQDAPQCVRTVKGTVLLGARSVRTVEEPIDMATRFGQRCSLRRVGPTGVALATTRGILAFRAFP